MNTVVDRLSNLPEGIAREILCFLPGEDLIRLSFVSKRYRKLCFSTPFLSFHDGFNLSDDGFNLFDDGFALTPPFDHISRIRRAKCIDSFMNLRHLEGTRIQSFSLCWFYCDSDDALYVNKWLFQAIDCGVQEINLVAVTADFQLPIPILNSKTLKKLSISSTPLRSILKPPSFLVRLNFLEYLKLQFVHLDGHYLNVGELVSSSCKCLKELFLVDCTGSELLFINSSSLWVFHLHYRKHHRQNHQIPQLKISARNLQELDIVWFPPFSTNVPSSLEICTPKLQVFNWMGNPIRHFSCLTKLAHLERAGLNFMEFPPNNSASDYAVDEVVRSIDNITCLQPLCLQSIAVLARGNGIPFMFHHLKSLVIVGSGLSAYEVAPLRSLLMGTPNLRELGITSRGLSPYSPSPSQAELISQSVAASYVSEYWESALLFFGQLKILTIELYEGPFLLELFKFLLKNAQLLEKVTVYYSPPSFPQEAAAIIAKFKKDSTIFSIRAI